jgi:hypothetical protein
MIQYAAGKNKMLRRSREIQVAVAPAHQEILDRLENPPAGDAASNADPLATVQAVANAFSGPADVHTSPPLVAKAMVDSVLNCAVAHVSAGSPPAPMLIKQSHNIGGNPNQSIALIELIHTRTDASAAALNIFQQDQSKQGCATKDSAAILEDGNEEPTTRMQEHEDGISVISGSSIRGHHNDKDDFSPV